MEERKELELTEDQVVDKINRIVTTTLKGFGIENHILTFTFNERRYTITDREGVELIDDLLSVMKGCYAYQDEKIKLLDGQHDSAQV